MKVTEIIQMTININLLILLAPFNFPCSRRVDINKKRFVTKKTINSLDNFPKYTSSIYLLPENIKVSIIAICNSNLGNTELENSLSMQSCTIKI